MQVLVLIQILEMKNICESQMEANRYYFVEMLSEIESLSLPPLKGFQWIPNSLHMGLGSN